MKDFFVMRLHSCSWWDSPSCLLLKELSDKGSEGFYLMKRARKRVSQGKLSMSCINPAALLAELSVFTQIQRESL